MSPRRPRALLGALLLCCLLYAALTLLWEADMARWTTDLSSQPSGASQTPQSAPQELQNATPSPKELAAEAHAASVRLLPPDDREQRQFLCIGWRATRDCTADGPRLPRADRPCTRLLGAGQAGYCELEDVDSGERFRVMRRNCNTTLKKGVFMRCADAPAFANFHVQVQQALNASTSAVNTTASQSPPSKGIVMAVYPKMIPSAYATIRVLRDVYDCRLPVELWFRPDELDKNLSQLAPLQQLAQNVSASTISFREIHDPAAVGFGVKVHAVSYSNFDRVLFLDADNTPTRDPSFLFESKEFEITGAVFWPDFWHPDRSIFHINRDSLLWELLDLPFVDMFEQESGQLLIDRRRHAAPLELVRFYSFHEPNLLSSMKLVHGDKDLFRLAWLKLNATFHMMETPPAIAGPIVNASFCGMTMVQHDFSGNVLFMHRNQNKLTGQPRSKDKSTLASLLEPAQFDSYPDPAIWTYVLSFRTSNRSNYVVQTSYASASDRASQSCYGPRQLDTNPHFQTETVAELEFSGLETQLRRFAMQATQLPHASSQNATPPGGGNTPE